MPAGKIRNSLVFEALRKFSLLLGYNSERFNVKIFKKKSSSSGAIFFTIFIFTKQPNPGTLRLT